MMSSSHEKRNDCSHEKAYRLSSTPYTEIAPCLPLPRLPVFCGALSSDLSLFDNQNFQFIDRPEILAQASRIAALLKDTDVSYLSLRDDSNSISSLTGEPGTLISEVLHYDPEAFSCSCPGFIKKQTHHNLPSEGQTLEEKVKTAVLEERFSKGPQHHSDGLINSVQSSGSSKSSKNKKKRSEGSSYLKEQELRDNQDGIIGGFCDMLDEICSRAETPYEEQDGTAVPCLAISDTKMLLNEILAISSKHLLHLVPVDTLVRLLNVLDRQIHHGLGLSIDENENIIERIIDFLRNQIMETMYVCDPSYRALHRPREDDVANGDENEDDEGEDGVSMGRKSRPRNRSFKLKKSIMNKISGAVYAVLQKLCSILGCLKHLLSIERLADSCILQLVKTSFTTFLVDNVQLLQLKCISVICEVFTSYSQHRTFLMDEVFHLLWKLPSSKRNLRAYHLPDVEQKQIQMVTALLIQLVQRSASRPETFSQILASDAIADVSDTINPTKCHEAATQTCCLFWSKVLQRWTAVKSQEGADAKIVMENLVVDLLTTLNLPEYPASGLILEVLCVLLLQNAGLKSKDVSARSMAIDLLGMVAARLKRDAVLCRQDKFWILQELVDGQSEVPNIPNDVCSVCLDGKGGSSLIVCQGCNRCFHGDCLGITGADTPTRAWLCQLCLCRRQLVFLQSYCKSQSEIDGSKSRGTGTTADSLPAIVGVDILQQILLNYLPEAGSADDMHLFARWFSLCLWFKDDPRSQKKFVYHVARMKSKGPVHGFGFTSSSLPRDSIKRISLALGRNSSFARGFDKILDLLLASLREKSPIIRAKALRAVSVIVETDPEVLGEKHVQNAVEGRFLDSAISVREAAMELVGRHIASHPDVAAKYFVKVAERIMDTGVSVRKRAIKIIRDMCISNGSFSETTNACLQIIARVNDDESSIQDLVSRTFYELWFEEPSGVQTQFVADGSSVPLEIAKKTEQIVGMMSKMPNHQPLVTVIKRNLALDFLPQSAKATGINAVALATVRKRCELMCKCLLERILQAEETDSEDLEVRALPYVLALHAFCVVDPTLCVPPSDPSKFVVTLHPYLKSQVNNQAVAQLLQSIIFIIDTALPLVRKPPQNFVEELEQDLKHMISRQSFLTVIYACIKCLCTLSKVSSKGARLIDYLIQRFFKHLDSCKDELKPENKEPLGRSLFCIGVLLRYGAKLISSNIDTYNVTILSILKRYLCSEDFDLKVRSLQALGYILIAKPEYMMDRDVSKILEATLSSGSDTRIKMQALQNLSEYLLDVEGQTENDDSDSMGKNGPEVQAHGVPVAAGAGDSNICGGIIQLHWNSILERCLDVNDRVRQSALKIVEIVLRQGLVHPITCVPYLIAMETDQQEVNSKLAHRLLMNMNEKYPAFFESRLGDGLQMSFNFMQSRAASLAASQNQNKGPGNLKGRFEDIISASMKLGISRIYRLIRGNRVSRNKFMSSVVRKFDSGNNQQSSLPFLIYCTEILAALPFTLPDEPLYLVYTLNRIIQVRAGPLESSMKTLISQYRHENDAKGPYENGIVEKQFEADDVCNHENPMSVDDFHAISEEDLHKLKDDCHTAIALQLLLRLKRHLKIVYNLSDARCQAFSPSEPLKSGETLSKQNVPFNVKDTPINSPTTLQDILLKYQEFKNLLKEDTVDYSAYSADPKRRRSRGSFREPEEGHFGKSPPPRMAKTGKSMREIDIGDRCDEDGGDDDIWLGGLQKPNYSGGRGRLRKKQR
ncbi:hypothetical protein AMTRI_Chr10g225240 [Amborella trichopoda]